MCTSYVSDFTDFTVDVELLETMAEAGFKKFMVPAASCKIVCLSSPATILLLGKMLHSKLTYITKSSCFTNLSFVLPSLSITLFGSTTNMF